MMTSPDLTPEFKYREKVSQEMSNVQFPHVNQNHNLKCRRRLYAYWLVPFLYIYNSACHKEGMLRSHTNTDQLTGRSVANIEGDGVLR